MSRIKKYLSNRIRIMEIDNIINAGVQIKNRAESMSNKRLFSPSERDKESFIEEVKIIRNAVISGASTSDDVIFGEINKLQNSPLQTIIHCIEIGSVIEKIGILIKKESKFKSIKVFRLSPTIRLTSNEYILLSSLVIIIIASFYHL